MEITEPRPNGSGSSVAAVPWISSRFCRQQNTAIKRDDDRERATTELRSHGRGNRYNRYIDAVVPTVPDRNRTDQPDKNKIINIGREFGEQHNHTAYGRLVSL